MRSRQQHQTKNFFEKDAINWSKKAKWESDYFVNVIKQRNQYVEKIASRFLSKDNSILDVGCGTGDLVISLLKKKYDAYGLDFSSTMIQVARDECKKQRLPNNRFFLDSFFDFDTPTKYNLISANGFIEYISEKELETFIKKSYSILKKNGLIVLGSRNRLFNIFSFNEYTEAEIKAGNLIQLIRECIIFNSSKDFKSVLKHNVTNISKNLKTHKFTGIEVKTRYQYTPQQIIHKLQRNGFKPIDLIPINIHVLTTGGKKLIPKVNDYTSNFLQQKKEVHMHVIPQSSSFMITAKKNES